MLRQINTILPIRFAGRHTAGICKSLGPCWAWFTDEPRLAPANAQLHFLTLLRRPRCNAALRAQRTCWIAGRYALPRNRVLGSRHVRSWPRHAGGGSPSSRVCPAKEIAWLPPSLYELPAAVSPGRAVIGLAIRHTPHSENEEEE